MSGPSRGGQAPPPIAAAAGWQLRGACARADPELFFPLDEELWAGPAKQLCARCPVNSDCLAHALATGERHGIWGGLTTAERLELLRVSEDSEGAA
jgi:WhiB family redox-sensing transcriptional regulator